VPLHPQLAQDCLLVGHYPLCRLLLMQDGNYPWFILVPDRADITEIHQLSAADQQQLLQESVSLSRALECAFSPDKLNIAALGNIVPQLHVHHVVRYRDDPAWPDPVWGRVARSDYTEESRRDVLDRLARCLPDTPAFSPAK
jgi:diadenosine tetraphosphate (Ap4A) HIT family hydrolase